MSSIRSTSKAVAQYQAQRAARKQGAKDDDNAAAALELTAFVIAIGSAVTESADERGWRSLRAQMHIARTRLPPGRHTVTIDTPAGPRSVEVNISGAHAFVGLRFLRGTLFAMLPAAPARAQRSAAAPEAARVPAVQEARVAPAPADARSTGSTANSEE